MSTYNAKRTQLVTDVRALLEDTEELLRAVSTESKEKIAGVRPRVEAAMQRARSQVTELEARVDAGARQAVQSADVYAHEHPWQAAGIAAAAGAAVGAVLGALLAKR